MSVTPADSSAQRPRRTRMFSRWEAVVAWLVGCGLALGIATTLVWQFVVLAIPPGHVGVRYSLLDGGTVTSHVLPEGLAFKLPWDRIYLFEVRTRRLPYRVHALTAEGMNAFVEGAVLYRPEIASVPEVLTTLGIDYDERVVLPLTVSIVRKVIGKYNSNELYSIDHEELQREVLELVKEHPLSEEIAFDDLLMTRIILPESITKAIETKLAQEQAAASYQFRIEAQKQEAERQRIQAIGIRNFYSIVSEALTDSLLTWRGIEATVELAQSPNSKIVIVGSGKDQLPLILGSDIGKLPKEPVPVPPIKPDQNQLPDWTDLPRVFSDTDLGDIVPALRDQPMPATLAPMVGGLPLPAGTATDTLGDVPTPGGEADPDLVPGSSPQRRGGAPADQTEGVAGPAEPSEIATSPGHSTGAGR